MTTAPGHRRGRATLLVVAAFALVLLVWWWVGSGRRGGSTSARAMEPALATPAEATTLPPAERSELETPIAAAPAAIDPRAPIIDEILVEKQEVCEGEENLVTVRAHDPSGDHSGLRSVVHGQPGWQVPVRAYANEDPLAPARTVTVVGGDGRATTAPIPPYKLKDCAAAARLRLSHALLPNSTAEFRLEVALLKGVMPGRPKPERFENGDFAPVSYEWDFGDGEKTTTAAPYVTHSYEMRDQRTYYSYFSLSVTAKDDRGKTMVARHALEIMNPAYEDLAQKQVVRFMTHNTPRFPEVVDGKVTQTIRIWHFRPEAVPVEKVIAYFYDPHGKELGHASVKPVALLGAEAVPPGGGLTIRTTLALEEHPGVGFITYELLGTAAGGLRAQGAFSIMRPPDPPTREKHVPVNDGLMAAKIKRSMEILGKQYITDEDIWELERQGKLDGLAPLPVPPGDEGPPADLPRPPRSDGEPWSPDDDPGRSEPPP